MPIRVRPVEAPTPPVTPPTPLPPTTPPAAPVVTWTPADGEPITLSRVVDSGFMLGAVGGPGRIIGLDMPPEAQFETEIAAGDGAIFQGARALARTFALPVVLHANTLTDLELHRRALIAAFDRRRGEGVFTVALPDGSSRSLNAMYSAGLDVPEQGRQGGGLYYDSYVVQLRARDPYPYGPESVVAFSPPSPVDFFPGPPFHISETTTTGDSEVVIDGEVPTFPTWVIHGPCSTLLLRNRDTGKSMSLTPSLVSGQALTIRTDPRTDAAQKFTSTSGTNVWASVAGQFPVLWPLQPGRNRVTVTAAGTETDSLIQLFYRPRYLTA